jgi:spore germination protein GerM
MTRRLIRRLTLRLLRPSTRVVAIVAVVLVPLASCGIPIDDETQAIADDDVPFELLDAAPTTSTTTTAAPDGSTTQQPEAVHLYLVRNDLIERRVRSVPAPVGLAERLEMLAVAPDGSDAELGYRSAVAPGSFTTVGPVLRGGVATVDLSADFTSVPTKEQVLAFAQITYTLTDLPGIGQVSFTLNGTPINALDDEGVAVDGNVTEDTYRDLFAST